MSTAALPESESRLAEVLARHWGFTSFRPLQQEAMEASLSGRDSLVVMPTGGGKSICYQAPALLRESLTVVVSPLISLMKDQVDGLRSCGVEAAQLDSTLSPRRYREIELSVIDGSLRLLFVSPERLAMSGFRGLLEKTGVSCFAIDEAHCISHWGHDFRPEYRQLRELRALFPSASFHAYTATATEQVRRDIALQLELRDPLVLVGDFDRPNLTYRVVPRGNELSQVEEVLARHQGEAGIVYCLRRRDVDAIAEALARRGHRVAAYHAGLLPEERHRAQEAFSREECDIVVATVAFGMGIDRSNVRFVLHTALPKSIEHYQQETGRAGRDGLDAECVLLYSNADSTTWRTILSKSEELDHEQLAAAIRHVGDMQRYAGSAVCRHRTLVEYFGQRYEPPNCSACDVCLDDHDTLPDSTTIAQKILSCIVRLRRPFGAGYVVSVLRGESNDRIRAQRHDELSTWGLLREHSRQELLDWIDQLIGASVVRSDGDRFPVLTLTESSRDVLRGEAEVQLVRRRHGTPARSRRSRPKWEGVDHELFELLRTWRRQEAGVRDVPPFVIFSDATLQHLAAARPTTTSRLRNIHGIGESKLAAYADPLLSMIRTWCAERGVTADVDAGGDSSSAPAPGTASTGAKSVAFEAFRNGVVLDDAAALCARARSTTAGYLADFILEERPESISPWVDDSTYMAVAAAADRTGTERLRPIFEELGERIDFETIRIVLAHMESRALAS